MRSSKLMPLPQKPTSVKKLAVLLDGSYPQTDPDAELNSGEAKLQTPAPFADFLNNPLYRGTGLKSPKSYFDAGFNAMTLQDVMNGLTPTDLDTDSP